MNKNKEQALNEFWSSFGVLAFEENTVPDDATIEELIKAEVAPSKYPYITYQVITGDLNGPVFPTASIWDRSFSWERADLLANKISKSIQTMNTIKLENGRVFIAKGSPFAQHMSEEGDASIRRVVLNIQAEFLTEY